MKSYTDLEQSKKLAEFLPLESADMHYVLIDTDKNKYSAGFGNYIGILPHYPCWSLTALLGLMPRIEHVKPFVDLSPKLDSEEVAIYYHSGDSPYIVKDNLVDACYEMIIELNKRKLL